MSEAHSSTTSSQAQLVSDIKAVIADAEEILGATADQGGEKISALRARIQERLQGRAHPPGSGRGGAARQDPRRRARHRCLCA